MSPRRQSGRGKRVGRGEAAPALSGRLSDGEAAPAAAGARDLPAVLRLLALMGAVIGMVGCQQQPEPKDNNHALLAAVRNQATPVTTMAVGYSGITQTVSLTGTIQSPRTANVTAAIPGQVLSVAVTEGSRVAARAVLATLNPTQTNIQITQAEQQVAAARSAYDKAVAGRNLETQQARGDVVTARNGLQQALTGLSKAEAGAGAATIAQAEANARAAHAGADAATAALKRTQFLFDHQVVPRTTLDDVSTKSQQATDNAAAADAAVAQARQGASPQDRQLAEEKVDQARQGLRAAEDAQRSRVSVAQADVNAAAAQLAQAQQSLRLAQVQGAATTIVSPLAGVVTTVRIHPGEAAMPGSPLFVITSLQGVYFETAVSEQDRLVLRPGQAAQITMDALPNRSLAGTVREIVPVENPGTSGFLVRIALAPQPVVVPPGAYARAVVSIGSAEHTLVVPLRAVITRPDGSKAVYRLGSDSTAEMATITTGLSNGTSVQILSGLNPGDQVVIVGTDLLQPGAKVVVQSTS